MHHINGYILRTLLGSIGLVLLVILALDVISALIDQLGERRNQYQWLQVLEYVSLTLPKRIYEYIPLSSLVGCMLGLGALASSSELVVIRAAGVSVARIAWMVMRPALLFMGLAVVLGEYVIPYTSQMAESRRTLAMGDVNPLEAHGLWNREGDEFIHINAALPNGKLYGVTRFTFNDQGALTESSHSQQAIYLGAYWQEEDVVVTRFGDEQLTSEQLPLRRWQTGLTPDLLHVLVLEPEDLSMRSLHSYAQYLDEQLSDSGEYWLAFWKKALQPLVIAGLVMIGISFIFGPLRQVTVGYRIFTGVVVGIVFRTAQDLLGPASLVFGFSPLLAVAIPIAVCFIIGVVLIRRS